MKLAMSECYSLYEQGEVVWEKRTLKKNTSTKTLRMNKKYIVYCIKYITQLSCYPQMSRGGYKTKTEDLRPKNEDPLKIFLKSLQNGSNMIFDWNKTGRNKILRFLSILARVFVLYKTPPKVQNEDPFQIV